MQSLPDSIAWRRQLLDLSQAQVAAAAGSTQATVSKLENGSRDVRLSTLLEIVRALGMDLRVVPNELLPTIDELIASIRSTTTTTDPDTEQPLYRLDDESDDGA